MSHYRKRLSKYEQGHSIRLIFEEGNDLDDIIYKHLSIDAAKQYETTNKLLKRIVINHYCNESKDFFSEFMSKVLNILDNFYTLKISQLLNRKEDKDDSDRNDFIRLSRGA